MQGKIVLGLGNNIDYEIRWDSAILETLIRKYEIKDEELSSKIEIANERDLVISILSFLRDETGGERFVHDPRIIEDFSQYFSRRITLGGTSVRAAIAMDKIGFDSWAHLVTINPHVRNLLPESCRYICSADDEQLYPHLIIQYHDGTIVNANDIYIRTGRANRIIYVNDLDNMLMRLSPQLGDLISEASVFLVSGFNGMQDEALLESRLNELNLAMEKLPLDAQVFYEDGCFHLSGFSELVRRKLLRRIHIYSLNEDEFQGYIGRKIALLDPEAVLTGLVDLRRRIPVPVLVVHTRYWALAYGDNASRYQNALKGGIAMAGTRFRLGDDFSMLDYRETMGAPLQETGRQFSEKINALEADNVCSLACIQAEENNATTIGLGDAFVGGFIPQLVSQAK